MAKSLLIGIGTYMKTPSGQSVILVMSLIENKILPSAPRVAGRHNPNVFVSSFHPCGNLFRLKSRMINYRLAQNISQFMNPVSIIIAGRIEWVRSEELYIPWNFICYKSHLGHRNLWDLFRLLSLPTKVRGVCIKKKKKSL